MDYPQLTLFTYGSPIEPVKQCPQAPQKRVNPHIVSMLDLEMDSSDYLHTTGNESTCSGILNQSVTSCDDSSYMEQKFDCVQLIGEGYFSRVYKARSIADRQWCAIKQAKHPFKGVRDRERALQEVRNLQRLSGHPHIMDILSAWVERGILHLQLELCRLVAAPITDEPLLWSLLAQMLSGLNHVHSQDLLHLDLKPSNMFISDTSGQLKLGDFGLTVNSSNFGDGDEGDARYVAPELLREMASPKADVFSLGCSMLELITGVAPPTSGPNWHALRSGARIDALMPPSISMNLTSVIQQMLHPDPLHRPSTDHLLALPEIQQALPQNLDQYRRNCSPHNITLTSIVSESSSLPSGSPNSMSDSMPTPHVSPINRSLLSAFDDCDDDDTCL